MVDIFVEMKDGIVFVKLMNIGEEDVWLSLKSRIGVVYSVELF